MSNKIISYSYILFIKGTKLKDDRLKYITDITHTYSSSGSDSLSIKVDDPDMYFIDDNIYTESVPVEFKAVLPYNNSNLSFKGYISAIDITFPNVGIPEVTLHCMDSTYKMNGVKLNRTWKNAKISDVVRQVLRKYNYTLHIDNTITVEESITQSNQSDIEFIKDLTSKLIEPFICYVSGSHFYFVRKNMNINPDKLISYRTGGFEILSFNPQISKESKKQEVTSSNISLLTSQVKTHVTNDMNVDRYIQGKPIIRK